MLRPILPPLSPGASAVGDHRASAASPQGVPLGWSPAAGVLPRALTDRRSLAAESRCELWVVGP